MTEISKVTNPQRPFLYEALAVIFKNHYALTNFDIDEIKQQYGYSEKTSVGELMHSYKTTQALAAAGVDLFRQLSPRPTVTKFIYSDASSPSQQTDVEATETLIEA